MRYSPEFRGAVLTAVEKTMPFYSADQYRLYPSVDRECWRGFLVRRLTRFLDSEDACLFFEIADGVICLLGWKISRWDEEHFGLGMASLPWFVCPDVPGSTAIMSRLLSEGTSCLREQGIKFVSAHISGEDIMGLHVLENAGFRYYQTTVYAVARCAGLPHMTDPAVRLWREADVPSVVQIAKHNQFPQGHYYCDCRFDRNTVDSMYEKWILTSWNQGEPIAVIESEGRIAGYFAFVMDKTLSQATKLTYGRMTSLAMDASVRERGLGTRLFCSVLSLIEEQGGQYVASEYPLKNYRSGHLHTSNLFYVTHEKVLFHLWL